MLFRDMLELVLYFHYTHNIKAILGTLIFCVRFFIYYAPHVIKRFAIIIVYYICPFIDSERPCLAYRFGYETTIA